MIRLNFQVREKEWLSAGFVAAAIRFDGDEYGINLSQPLGIIEFQHPAFFRCIIHVKDPKIECLLRVGPSPSPRLKSSGILQTRLLIEVVGVEDQRLSLPIVTYSWVLLRKNYDDAKTRLHCGTYFNGACRTASAMPRRLAISGSLVGCRQGIEGAEHGQFRRLDQPSIHEVVKWLILHGPELSHELLAGPKLSDGPHPML